MMMMMMKIRSKVIYRLVILVKVNSTIFSIVKVIYLVRYIFLDISKGEKRKRDVDNESENARETNNDNDSSPPRKI